MTKILIVDNSPGERLLAGRLIENPEEDDDESELTALYATSGEEALEILKSEHPDAVVTDLQMRDMDAVALVQQVRSRFPFTPVILMTGDGHERVAAKALRYGAASYVPKSDFVHDLRHTVATVLEAAYAKRGRRRLMGCLTQTESQYVLENDPALIPHLVGHLKETLAEMTDLDDTILLRVSIALREALLNAMEHGNLELDSNLREDDGAAYHRLAEQRRKQKPYSDRRVLLRVRETPKEATYIIRDQGRGFDPAKLADPCEECNLERASGRGLLLIRTFMTEVHHNKDGNEITLILRTSKSS